MKNSEKAHPRSSGRPRVAVLIDVPSTAEQRRAASAAVRALKAARIKAWIMGASAPVTRLTKRLATQKPDAVLHGASSFDHREDGGAHVAGLLEMFGLPFSGGSMAVRALARDSVRARAVLRGAGLPEAAEVAEMAASNPLIHCHLIEQGQTMVPLMSSDVPSAVSEPAQALALAAFEAFGCRQTARVTLQFDDQQANGLQVVAIDPAPDIGPFAELAQVLETSGYDYEEMLVRFVRQHLLGAGCSA